MIFHTKYPKIFRAFLHSAQFFLSAPPPPPPNLKSWIRPCIYVYIYIYIYILKIAELDCCQNYNIKYICTIYTRLYTCLTSIPRFSLRDKVTLRLLKLLFQGVDVVEWSRALDVRLSEWCCSVSMVWVQMVWVQIPSREEQKFDSSKI